MMKKSTWESERQDLMQEARVLFSSFFAGAPSKKILELYVNAHLEIEGLGKPSIQESITIYKILKYDLKPLEIEPWLRRKGRRHLLTQKLMLMMYICECGGYAPQIRSANVGFFYSVLYLLLLGIKVVCSLLRGKWQVMRYKLV
ncbi:hypothetical protein [Gelidibacter japonicus]|uniref:hypothetical protein n=1 Tax=Gelidibacter japonicus TaxID=1962232 RepID=UPI003A92E6CA